MKADLTVNCPGCNALQNPDIRIDDQGRFEPGKITLYFDCQMCRRSYKTVSYELEEWEEVRKQQAKNRLKKRAQRRKAINDAAR